MNYNAYYRNRNQLARCQTAYDEMLPPEYWNPPWDDEEEEAEVIDPEEGDDE